MDNQPHSAPQPPALPDSQINETVGEPLGGPTPQQKQPTTKETVQGCGCLVLLVLLALFSFRGCFSGGASSEGATTGISYSQMMGHGMGELFDMKQSSDVDGRTRYMGESKSGTAVLELIGEKDDLYKATLIMGMPGRDSTATLHAGFTLAFLGNADSTWTGQERSDWFAGLAKQFAGKDNGKASIIRGRNRITAEMMESMGLTLTVEAAQ